MRKLTVWFLLVGVGAVAGWLLGSDGAFRWISDHPLRSITQVEPWTRSASQPPHRRLGKDSDQNIQSLLIQGQYQTVLRQYETAHHKNDDALRTRYKKLILRHLFELIDAGRHTHSEQLLNGLLEIEPNDIEVMLALAELYRQRKDFANQINTLYTARSYAHLHETITHIESQIRSTVTVYAEQLSKQDNKPGLLELYQLLTGVEPDYAPYVLALAEVQASLGLYQEASQSLRTVMYDPALSAKVTKLLHEVEKKIHRASRANESIPLTRRGQHYLVNAWINEVRPLRLLLDTGASLTVIKPSALIEIGIDPWASGETRRFNTANGIVVAPVITLSGLKLGNRYAEDVAVAAIDISGDHDIDGLLGMNYLQNYTFFIDQKKNALILSGGL